MIYGRRMTANDKVTAALKAIANGRQDMTPDVRKAIDLGLAEKVESAIAIGFKIILTPEGIARIGHF